MTEIEAEAERASRTGRKWYAVLDWNHRHDALLRQADQNPNDLLDFPGASTLSNGNPIEF